RPRQSALLDTPVSLLACWAILPSRRMSATARADRRSRTGASNRVRETARAVATACSVDAFRECCGRVASAELGVVQRRVVRRRPLVAVRGRLAIGFHGVRLLRRYGGNRLPRRGRPGGSGFGEQE